MAGEDRRVMDKDNWEGINKFISESREYRAADSERQLNLLSDISEIKTQVSKTNGRVTALEFWRTGLEKGQQDKKDYKANRMMLIGVVCTVIMAVSAIVVIVQSFKPH
jgi:hypothetical protein